MALCAPWSASDVVNSLPFIQLKINFTEKLHNFSRLKWKIAKIKREWNVEGEDQQRKKKIWIKWNEPNEIKRETAVMKCNNGNICMKMRKYKQKREKNLTTSKRESEIDCSEKKVKKNSEWTSEK